MSADPSSTVYIHATAVVLGERGILIEGASGSGKSSVAAALLQQAAVRGCFARLIGDDRVGLTVAHGRLVARPHPAIAGLIERRGTGLVPIGHEPACVIHCAVQLLSGHDTAPARHPEMPALWQHRGIAIPLLVLQGGMGTTDAAARIAEALDTQDYNHSNGLAYSPAMQKIPPHCEAGGQVAGRDLNGSFR